LKLYRIIKVIFYEVDRKVSLLMSARLLTGKSEARR